MSFIKEMCTDMAFIKYNIINIFQIGKGKSNEETSILQDQFIKYPVNMKIHKKTRIIIAVKKRKENR